jgi:hypothetical protein
MTGDVVDMILFAYQTDLVITLRSPAGCECLIARLPMRDAQPAVRSSFPFPLTGKVPAGSPIRECRFDDLDFQALKLPGVIRGDLRFRPGNGYVKGLSGAIEVACALRIDGVDDASDVLRQALDEARKKRRIVSYTDDSSTEGGGGGDPGGDGAGGQLPS